MSSDEDILDSPIAKSNQQTSSVKRFLNRSFATPKIIKHPKNCSTPNKSFDVDAIDNHDDNESFDLSNNNVASSLNESSVLYNKRSKCRPNVILSDDESSPNQSVNEDDEVSEATRGISSLEVLSEDDLSEDNEYKDLAVNEDNESDTVSDSQSYVASSHESASHSDDVVPQSDDDDDVISVSSTDEKDLTPLKRVVKQSPLKNHSSVILSDDESSPNRPENFTEEQIPQTSQSIKVNEEVEKIKVSQQEFQIQSRKVAQIKEDISKSETVLRTVDLNSLPDKGISIKYRKLGLENLLAVEMEKLSNMVIDNANQTKIKVLNIDEINRQAGDVQPRSFGKMAMSTYNAEKDKVVDGLQRIYGSLKDRPEESNLAENPAGLKIPLMAHQRSALNWLMWREKQTPSGGILADDMGLGKTLTMISLVLKVKELKENLVNSENSDTETEDDSGIYKIPGHTLVLCPASVIDQWYSEATTKTSRGLLSVEVFHGPKRETNPKRLASFDIVITTLATMSKECSMNRSIFKMKWRRIIIDEAHQIRNTKAEMSIAACKLSARSRWALTGTPVQNKEHDMFALLKFLRCKPFDEEHVWKRWVANRGPSGQERLQAVISSLILRRTKVELTSKGELGTLPERKWEVIPIKLNREELQVYNRILVFSKHLFTEFLHQNAEKRQNSEYFHHGTKDVLNTMREKVLQVYKGDKINQVDILVLLLRLRQMCCHPSLIIQMIENLDGCLQDEPEPLNELNLLDQLTKLNLNDDENQDKLDKKEVENEGGASVASEGLTLFNPKNPFYSKKTISSKIKAMLQVLKDQILVNNDKAVIVSQWSSFLRIIGYHLKKEGICADQLDGSVPVQNRGEIVANFNKPNHSVKVLLLSLTAGGVGLNLMGANHLFLLDLHWNPQLEKQAQDRIYRVGQKKPVFIYKVMADDTIEKRILELQQKKLDIAESMLTGARQVTNQNKLTLQDLKMLFEM